jgi:hypothetical protein
MIKYDGVKRYQEIKEKIEKSEELTDKDLMDIVFLALMKNEKEEEEVVEEAIKLATKIADEDKKDVVIGAVLAIADKYVREQYISKLKEVIRMTRIGASLFEEGIEKGKLAGALEERKEVVVKLLTKRFGKEFSKELQGKILKTDEKTIDYIMDNLLEITINELKEILK